MTRETKHPIAQRPDPTLSKAGKPFGPAPAADQLDPAVDSPGPAADLRQTLDERDAEIRHLASELEGERKHRRELEEEVLRQGSLRAAGHIVEMDYGYKPRVRDWRAMPYGTQIERGTTSYRPLLTRMTAFADRLLAIRETEPDTSTEPYWGQSWFGVLDGLTLYGLLAELNPPRYVEVGSGNSTKFARRAIRDLGLRTKITSIDPHPRAVIDEICDEVVRARLEDCDLNLFSRLGPRDMVFIDNSHRSFQGSDVTVFFTEILPRLSPGLVYGIHDIFLPLDYPDFWLDRYYNEMYLLMAYLLGGAAGDSIVLPVHYVQKTDALRTILEPVTQRINAPTVGGAFWMRRASLPEGEPKPDGQPFAEPFRIRPASPWWRRLWSGGSG